MLKGKTALVTGGSRGIGKEIITAFLKEGASICCVDLMETEFKDEYENLAAESGAKIIYKQTDVSNEEQINTMVKECLEEFSDIDILVNNAGITKDKLLMRMEADEWNKVISVNLTSAFFLSKALSRHMIKRRSGNIINISSIVGVMGNAGQVNYCSSKAGLIGLTKSLARELGGKNIRVNAVAPGFIRSAMTDILTEEQQKAYFTQIPLVRFGEAAEVAKAVLFLASDLSSYITGHVLHVTGGLGM